MKSALLIFPGSNGDLELQRALEEVGFTVIRVWHKDTELPSDTEIVFIPGGFSFGDYLRPGAIAAKSKILNAVIEFANGGGYIVGICNGFQILLEAKLLPGALLRNIGQRFICENVDLIVEVDNSIYTNNFSIGQNVTFPIAHYDGNYFCDDETLKTLIDNGRVPFTYKTNPNGSAANIAAVLSHNKRVMGLMPHPERPIYPSTDREDALKFFQSIIKNI